MRQYLHYKPRMKYVKYLLQCTPNKPSRSQHTLLGHNCTEVRLQCNSCNFPQLLHITAHYGLPTPPISPHHTTSHNPHTLRKLPTASNPEQVRDVNTKYEGAGSICSYFFSLCCHLTPIYQIFSTEISREMDRLDRIDSATFVFLNKRSFKSSHKSRGTY
jgi:hypothetical protein